MNFRVSQEGFRRIVREKTCSTICTTAEGRRVPHMRYGKLQRMRLAIASARPLFRSALDASKMKVHSSTASTRDMMG
eukprot:2457840-Pleurochrysis_carterae.AAC.3